MLPGFGARNRGILLLMFVALAILACGGGGGGGGSQESLAPASIDANMAERSAALTLASRELSELNENLADGPSRSATGASLRLGGQMLALMRARILSGAVLERSGSVNAPADCDSGQGHFSFTWDGPQPPVEACAVQNLKAEFDFTDCQEGTAYKNGKVTMRMTGSACAPTAIFLQFSDFTLEDENSGSLTTMSDLRINYTDIGYSGGEIIRMTVELEGDVVASAGMASFNMQFDRYVLGIVKASAATTSLTIHGALTGTCLDGWVTVETLTPLLFSDGGSCPTEGVLKFTGDGEATLSFSNSSANLDIPGEPTIHYQSCSDLPDNC